MSDPATPSGSPFPRFREHRAGTATPASNSAENRAESEISKPSLTSSDTAGTAPAADRPKELGGPKGPEPTRYGDWERDGRCVDF